MKKVICPSDYYQYYCLIFYEPLTNHPSTIHTELVFNRPLSQFQDGVAPTASPLPPQSDGLLASDRDLFIDDDGSGLEIDESSGSGWGPGVDDEDGRGSGDAPLAPEDDEDYGPIARSSTVAPTTIEPDDFLDTPTTEPPILIDQTFDVVSRE